MGLSLVGLLINFRFEAAVGIIMSRQSPRATADPCNLDEARGVN